MPIIKSAIKRVRQQEKRRQRNLITKDRYKALVKEFTTLIENGKKAEAAKMYPTVQKAIDMAAKKNLLHDNTAGRKKSQLAKMIAGEAAPKAAAAPKKPAAKKAPAKKAAAPKKAAAKKPAAKKATK